MKKSRERKRVGEPIDSLKSKGFELSDNILSESENQSDNECQMVAKEIALLSYDVNDLFVFDDIIQIYLWIIDSGCSKHMAGNHALLTNFVEKFLGTVRFGNNDFVVIAGYEDVVIGSMTIKKVYYFEDVIFSMIMMMLESSRKNEILECFLEPSLSNLNETEKASNPTVSQVSDTSKKDLEDLFHDFYYEYFDASKITKSPTTNVETSNEEISPSEEVFHESSESFQEESSSSSLNADV
ncbi:hypothetical protein Tco_1066600 [Tanacetum coccineum]|uniref:Retrovirus-related Pol polyprotein from transposon TNT 1-94-like beta-barrel domain-containing protein n=1 Tax=Tanacetum coccineum TaxID=301880 RepID=A0ABQ5HAY1_9ASTR